MEQYQRILRVQTPSKFPMNMARQVEMAVAESKITTGLCTWFLRHASASLVIQENADPDVLTDLENF